MGWACDVARTRASPPRAHLEGARRRGRIGEGAADEGGDHLHGRDVVEVDGAVGFE